MQRQVLMDKLSEFLMVEQCGFQLYTVVAARASDPMLRQRYEEFGRETAHHREVLVRLITRIGGDPNYVSPTARLAQWKSSKLLESSLAVDGLSQEEIEANDLENVLLAETKDHADWSLLQQMAQQMTQQGDQSGGVTQAVEKVVVKVVDAVTGDGNDPIDPTMLGQALQEAVAEVEQEEDEHLRWARETLAQMSMRMAVEGPAPSPERWQRVMTGPVPPIDAIHPRPVDDGLLPPAQQPPWQDAEVARAMQAQMR
jgi:rubrerythrin